MTNQQHPITPPAELVQQWILDKQLGEFYSELNDPEQYFATQAAQWGADQELEACCEVLHQHDHAYLLPSQLRIARRPKPPSWRTPMADLSPAAQAAQAVLDAYDTSPFDDDLGDRVAIAAALRAAADQVVPEEPWHGGDQRLMYERDAHQSSRRKLLDIAAELDGANNTSENVLDHG
jgi:hypothetical protein